MWWHTPLTQHPGGRDTWIPELDVSLDYKAQGLERRPLDKMLAMESHTKKKKNNSIIRTHILKNRSQGKWSMLVIPVLGSRRDRQIPGARAQGSHPACTRTCAHRTTCTHMNVCTQNHTQGPEKSPLLIPQGQFYQSWHWNLPTPEDCCSTAAYGNSCEMENRSI